MAVDVVVVNYRTDDLLQGFARSYAEHKFAGCELIVVEVDPVLPFMVDQIQKIGIEHTHLVQHENVGYGRACNEGARSYRGSNDVILLANADTLLTSGFAECYDALMANDDWGVLGPRQVNEHNQITAGGIFGHDQSPAQRGWNEQDQGQYSDIREDALSVSGALYFIKRKVWQELTDCETFQQTQPGSQGAFLETKLYFEEMFCSLHARAHGYKCVYYGPVQMTHYWHKSISDVVRTGGWGEDQFQISQQMHREACAAHGIISE